MQLGVWDETNLLVGDIRVYLSARCGVADVTFVGDVRLCVFIHV